MMEVHGSNNTQARQILAPRDLCVMQMAVNDKMRKEQPVHSSQQEQAASASLNLFLCAVTPNIPLHLLTQVGSGNLQPDDLMLSWCTSRKIPNPAKA